MISRDGATKSLWQESVENYVSDNHTDFSALYDVIIVGGGITGISTALLLQEAGKKCAVLEAYNLCFGTTGGTTAHLNTFFDTTYETISKNFNKETAKLIAQSARDAITLIQNNIKKYQIDCGFGYVDAYLFAANEAQEKDLKTIKESGLTNGVEIEDVLTLPIKVDFTKIIKIKNQAKFIPARYVYGLAKAFEKAGGVIVQDCQVTGAEQNEIIKVETTKGEFSAQALIYATHIPPGVNLIHLRCAPWRSYAMAFTVKDNKYPDSLIYDLCDPYNYYRSQTIDGKTFLIGGGFDHKTAHEENTEMCFRKLEAHLRSIFEVEEIVNRWSSQYFEPADGIPYVGHLPGHHDNIYVATGFSGNGMIYSAVAAMTLKSMLLDEENPLIKVFNPNRIKPVAGFVNFIKHNAGVVKSFASKLFSGEELNELSDLAPGEAKIVKFEHHKIGVYKDNEGALHVVHPACTHLQCEVKWNNAELSWDCPCHGARYSFNGDVLTGPADRALELINIGDLVKEK